MKKVIKIALVVTVLSLALAAVTLFASGTNEPSANIERYNLTFKDSVYISYAVSFDNVPDGAECGILVWKEAQSAYTVDSEGYTKITEVSSYASFGETRCNVYNFKQISATEFTSDIYAVAFINDGGNYTYSSLSKYSVLQYAYNKLGISELGTPTDDEGLVALLNALLDYGAAAQVYFGENTERLANAQYYMLSVYGGTLPDLSSGGLYLEGLKLLITAPEQKDGKQFVAWVDKDGNVIGTDPILEYTVPTANSAITAKYSEN